MKHILALLAVISLLTQGNSQEILSESASIEIKQDSLYFIKNI